jgi:hypothetical protein
MLVCVDSESEMIAMYGFGLRTTEPVKENRRLTRRLG